MSNTTVDPLADTAPNGTDFIVPHADLTGMAPAEGGGSDDTQLDGTRPITGTVCDPNRTDTGGAGTE